jgi:uroporphyrinogen decarboxylase
MHEKNKQMYKLLAEGPSVAIFDYEDTSSTIVSPMLYEKYCARYLDDYARICHDAGKLYITHMCGKLSAFNQQIRVGEMDGIDSVCPPTTGDIWAHEARREWGEEKIILGGLEPSALVCMTADETRAYVTRVLEQMPTFRSFILSTGDATAYGTPLENLETVSAVVAAYGWK